MTIVASVVTLTTEPAIIKATDASKNIGVTLYNNTTDTAYLGGSTGLTTANGLPLPAGGTFDVQLVGVYSDALFGKTDSTSLALNVLTNRDTTG
jgi:hypothetical protein